MEVHDSGDQEIGVPGEPKTQVQKRYLGHPAGTRKRKARRWQGRVRWGIWVCRLAYSSKSGGKPPHSKLARELG